MHLLLVSATAAEIRGVLSSLGLPGNHPPGTRLSAQAGSLHISILISGVGVPSTLLHLGRMNPVPTWDLIVNAGIAGSFREKYSVGQTLRVGEEAFGDLGIMLNESFFTLAQKGLEDANSFPYRDGRISLELPAGLAHELHWPPVKGLTVTAMHAGVIEKSGFVQAYNPDIETMEGAAVALFSAWNRVPCLALRTVSNQVSVADSRHWELDKALDALNEDLLSLLGILEKGTTR